MKYERTNVWEQISDEELQELEAYNKEYMAFLSQAKTERLAHDWIVKAALEAGFKPLEEALQGDVKPGDKIVASNHGKGAALFVLGEDIAEGMDIVGSHIDAPRLDIKAVPLHEEGNMAYLRTHYYGGVKLYHWLNLPLALHGVMFKKDGTKVDIHVGEDPDDPVFYINDLLIHLSHKLLQEKASDVIKGEQLQVVIGHSSRGKEKDGEGVADNVRKFLLEKYGVEEADFMSAELEVVPAGPAREVGFDRSLIAGHGHDDRICSFANLKAVLEAQPTKRTKVGLFVDKEEVGSQGNTGMLSAFFENAVAELLGAMHETYDERYLKRAFAHSRVLSADVTAAYDPQFEALGVFEKQNAAMLGCGVSISKYTGSGGKGGSNDANAEFLSDIRQVFEREGVIYQTAELGAVNAGGGGTIAYILANAGAEVVDCGTGMLSMHAPIELASKADAYETYRAYRAFWK
ncbi:MAG: aminopeptidase [Peptoniphilaceae bacterium]|nr:aminopeptidase [Peptoniphilaceae bacterium]MDY6086311.1 aminopeptidase [Peptoniphilaceae bacterium]